MPVQPHLIMLLGIAACGVSAEQTPATTTGPSPVGPPPPSAPAPPETPTPNGQTAVAYGLWVPGDHDTCSKEQHDSYRVVGPDGKWYPTWHPPVDPVTGCSFGHEHGRDPRGSDLYALTGPIPFGVANEALLESGLGWHRHEDHVGHKIEWVNDAVFSGAGASKVCDGLVKIHQGSHSKDAFTNNLHEVAYHLVCDDGTRIHFTTLSALGSGGNMRESCTASFLNIGTPVPAESPTGVGSRSIPTRHCVDKHISGGPRTWVNYGHALTETWAVDPVATMADGRRIAYLAMYFTVSSPSRFYDPEMVGGLARTIDICFEVDEAKDGRTMGPCAAARQRSSVAWNDPESPFKGTRRTLRWNQPILGNAGGFEVVYTDALGRNGRATPFPGSIRQYFAAIDNGGRNVAGPGVTGDFDAPGVHAPN